MHATAHPEGGRYTHKDVIITVDTGSAVPAFEQLRQQVLTMAHSGVLPPGSRLPTIRQLASDLGLAPGTVNRAYRQLETDGVIETRGRHGCFLTHPAAISSRERSERLSAAAHTFARIAKQLGVSDQQALSALSKALSGGPRT
jgi:GntR family transcriptional regulator